MPGPPLVHDDGGLRERVSEVAHAAGVIEVDVRDDDRREVVAADPQLRQRRDHGAGRPGGAGLDEARS